MSALPAVPPFHVDERRAAITVRVTDPGEAPGLVSYLNRLGLRPLAGSDGTIGIRPWDDVDWHEARVEILSCIDSWVHRHRTPVQLC